MAGGFENTLDKVCHTVPLWCAAQQKSELDTSPRWYPHYCPAIAKILRYATCARSHRAAKGSARAASFVSFVSFVSFESTLASSQTVPARCRIALDCMETHRFDAAAAVAVAVIFTASVYSVCLIHSRLFLFCDTMWPPCQLQLGKGANRWVPCLSAVDALRCAEETDGHSPCSPQGMILAAAKWPCTAVFATIQTQSDRSAPTIHISTAYSTVPYNAFRQCRNGTVREVIP